MFLFFLLINNNNNNKNNNWQIEFSIHCWFVFDSDANIAKDEFLKSNMDEEGWVPITLIANFPRVSTNISCRAYE
jgi:predicted DNA-binding transcriptional regulator